MNYMFYNTSAFINKYNNGLEIPYRTEDIKDWFNLNRDKMNDLDIKDRYGKEIDGFFSNFSNIELNNKQLI